MVDKKITELDALGATPDATDILVIVDDIAGTATTKKVTSDNLVTKNAAVLANTAKVTNVSTNIAESTKTATTVLITSSDGTNATLTEADTDDAGLLGSAKWDEIVANTSAKHTQNTDTALGAQTEDLDMNTHQVTGLDAPAANGEAIRQTAKITEAKMEAADDHVNDNTQAHSDYLLNNASDTTTGTITAAGFTTTGTSSLAVTTVADHGTTTTDQVVNVCYGTSATPPTASTTTEGCLYIQYTA